MLADTMKRKQKNNMKKPCISLICAINKNRGIGLNNKLLYDIPNDLKYFQKITSGHPVIMGLKTYQSIGRPLPKRTNIILCPDDIKIAGAVIAHSIEEAINIASQADKEEIFFIGGGQVYAQSINYADRLYLTVIDDEHDADVYFPDYTKFNKIISSQKESSVGLNYEYLILEK